jgi:hypothetical protein
VAIRGFFSLPRRWFRPRIIARVLFALALLHAVLSLVLYGIAADGAPHAFPLIARIKAQPLFSDLRWVTTVSECDFDLYRWGSQPPASCAEAVPGGLLGYPPLSIQVARWLSVRVGHTAFLGVSFGLATVALLTSFAFRVIASPLQRDLITALLLLSFPMQLALERGNIDMVLLLLTATLAAALAGPGARFWPVQASLAWLLVAIKAYPFAGLIAWSAAHGLERRRIDPASAAVVGGCLLGLRTVLPWLRHSRNAVAAKAPGLSSHGFAQFGLELGLPSPTGIFDFILLYKWGIIFVGFAFLLGRRQGLHIHFARITQFSGSPYTRRFLHIFPALSGFLWLGCYFLSTSVDYRLIFALPAIACLLVVLAEKISLHGYLSPAGLLATVLTLTLLNPIPALVSAANSVTVSFAVTVDNFSEAVVLPSLAGSLLAMLLPELPPPWGSVQAGSDSPRPSRRPLRRRPSTQSVRISSPEPPQSRRAGRSAAAAPRSRCGLKPRPRK